MSTNNYSFSESDFRFTNPVRYFTSTDPYYWEVDNIPLKQLQENDLWLKDQIEDGFKNLKFSFGRSDFQELLPYSDATNNIVKVKPGRFTARINSLHDTRLQKLTRVFGDVFNEYNRWRYATYADEELRNNIDKITSEVADDALFMNGLVERVFAQLSRSPYEAFEDLALQDGYWPLINPFQNIFFRSGNNSVSGQVWQDVTKWNAYRGFYAMGHVESLFTKYWRGAYRLAVVDVSEELSIEIPPFNQRDFDYYDEDGNLQQNNNAETRIDLLFIYSKPVDASSVKVKTSNTQYRTITEPELGLVRGAGVVLNKNPFTEGEGFTDDRSRDFGVESLDTKLDENGNLQILASPADQMTDKAGFKGANVRGSFPAPDDIMNISPLLIETLEAEDPRLVGQSILPVAYVVVRRSAGNNAFGEVIITNNDLIDIRPLMRTSELSYNERAGLAAAVPQVSIANPVVTDVKLKYTVAEIIEDYTAKIDEVRQGSTPSNNNNNNTNNSNYPRIVGQGFIQGGFKYGPESAIRNYWMTSERINSTQGTQKWNTDMNRPTGQSASYLPDWDVADWVPGGAGRGEFPNDCVHLIYYNRERPYGAASSEKFKDGGRITQGINDALVYYCKKTIILDKTNVGPWMDYYTVNLQYENCIPFTAPGIQNSWQNNDIENGFNFAAGGSSNIFVETKKTEFTIYCFWTAMQVIPFQSNTNNTFFKNSFGFDYQDDPYVRKLKESGLKELRNNPEVTAGHIVLNSDFSTTSASNGSQVAGICILPTISFEVVGYPSTFAGRNNSYKGADPVLRLT